MTEDNAFELDQVADVVAALYAFDGVMVGANASDEDIMHLVFAGTIHDLIFGFDRVQIGVTFMIVADRHDVGRLLRHHVAGHAVDGINDHRRLFRPDAKAVVAEPLDFRHAIPMPMPTRSW